MHKTKLCVKLLFLTTDEWKRKYSTTIYVVFCSGVFSFSFSFFLNTTLAIGNLSDHNLSVLSPACSNPPHTDETKVKADLTHPLHVFTSQLIA